MLLTAIGCNIAWGLTDAVMYLVTAVVEKRRGVTLLRSVRRTTDLQAAHRMIADELPERLAGGAQEATLEAIRRALVAVPEAKTTLTARDDKAALGVFAIRDRSAGGSWNCTARASGSSTRRIWRVVSSITGRN
jgi:hypothetical protein